MYWPSCVLLRARIIEAAYGQGLADDRFGVRSGRLDPLPGWRDLGWYSDDRKIAALLRASGVPVELKRLPKTGLPYLDVHDAAGWEGSVYFGRTFGLDTHVAGMLFFSPRYSERDDAIAAVKRIEEELGPPQLRRVQNGYGFGNLIWRDRDTEVEVALRDTEAPFIVSKHYRPRCSEFRAPILPPIARGRR
jgi:hypothetical protein